MSELRGCVIAACQDTAPRVWIIPTVAPPALPCPGSDWLDPLQYGSDALLRLLAEMRQETREDVDPCIR